MAVMQAGVAAAVAVKPDKIMVAAKLRLQE
jgi:hypothetical protein